MPNPSPKSAAAAGDGMTDPQWKFFLENVHSEGSSYAIKAPADGATPSYMLKYEKPRVANGEARGASAASPGGARDKRRKLEEKNNRKLEEKEKEKEKMGKEKEKGKMKTGKGKENEKEKGKMKFKMGKEKEKARKEKGKEMEKEMEKMKTGTEKEKDSSPERLWYDHGAPIDSSYRLFLENVRLEKGRMVLEYEGQVITYDMGDSSEAEEEPEPELSSDGPAATAPDPDLGGRHAPAEKVKDEYEDEDDREENDGEVEDVAAPASGGNGAMEEDEAGPDLPVVIVLQPEVCDSRMPGQKVKEEEEDEEEEEQDDDDDQKEDSGMQEEREFGSYGSMMIVSEPVVCNSRALEQMVKVEDEDDQMLDVPAMETPEAANLETNSNNAKHYTDPGLNHAIWPPHITQREESDFKQKLMDVLSKPFSQEECDKLFDMAIIRNPVTKERRTRHGVKFYYSALEKSQSYFDRYPDLASQVKDASNPNRLALLRGFFFWLENVGHEDQFRPWRDDHTHYKVISLM